MVGEAFWTFVDANLGADPNRLRLKYHGCDLGLDMALAITQIECRKRFGKKLSETLAAHPHWLFPTVLSGEQSTSDRLASYHATLIELGDRVADLTSGLGIDALHLSTIAGDITAIEIEENKVEALRYNFDGSDVRVVCDDCRRFLEAAEARSYDVLFIDPARRAADGSRVYALSDCEPDVKAMLPQMRRVAKRLIVKMSPMLDITQVANTLPGVTRIIALGTETECKELIAVVDLQSDSTSPMIEAVTLLNDGGQSTLKFTADSEREAKVKATIGTIKEGDCVYEPYPAVMKAGAYNTLQERYGLRKAHHNTQVFFRNEGGVGGTASDHSESGEKDEHPTETKDAKVECESGGKNEHPAETKDAKVECESGEPWPGAVMKVERVIPYNSKYIKRIKKEYGRINVATRNFDISADALRKKLGVTDGGERRLLGITTADGSRVLLCLSRSI